MKKVKLTKELKRALNRYLVDNYNYFLDIDLEEIEESGKDYIICDTETSNFFYVPKKAIVIEEENK